MRVFVFGAGASFHAGYPLAAQMGNFLAAWINTLPPEHQYRSWLEQIAGLYGGLENFESILADLMTAAPGSRAASLGVARHNLLSDLLKEALRGHFDSIRSAPAPLYDLLARVLRQGDVVITFNYDLGVERALRAAGLWGIKTGYGFLIEEAEQPSLVEVLKLHGSTNWRALLFGGRAGFFAGGGNSLGNRPVLFFRPDLEYLGYTDFVDPRCVRLDSAASLPAMIMPALPKTFYFATTYGAEWNEFWDALWRRAECAIANADELAIIGYSLPIADERARAMLLESANKAVGLSICCGKATATLEQEFRDHGFTNIQTGTHTFEDFLTRETATACAGADQANIDKGPSRLNALIGRRGVAYEVWFTILAVYPAHDLPAETDDGAIQTAIDRSQFLVRFDNGTLIDGSDTRVISGRDISRISGKY